MRFVGIYILISKLTTRGAVHDRPHLKQDCTKPTIHEFDFFLVQRNKKLN